jgi:L-asparagine oxygenase
MEAASRAWAQVESEGYVFLRQFLPESEPAAAFASIGQVDGVEGLDIIQTLTPREATTSTPNTYSGNFGIGDFPLHTDLAHWAMPPRYVVLRCISGSNSDFDGTAFS